MVGGGVISISTTSVSNNTMPNEVAFEKDNVKTAEKNLNTAQKAFDSSKKTYEALPDDASKEDIEKAYNDLQTTYSKLETAQKTDKKNTDNSGTKSADKELAANKKIAEQMHLTVQFGTIFGTNLR